MRVWAVRVHERAPEQRKMRTALRELVWTVCDCERGRDCGALSRAPHAQRVAGPHTCSRDAHHTAASSASSALGTLCGLWVLIAVFHRACSWRMTDFVVQTSCTSIPWYKIEVHNKFGNPGIFEICHGSAARRGGSLASGF